MSHVGASKLRSFDVRGVRMTPVMRLGGATAFLALLVVGVIVAGQPWKSRYPISRKSNLTEKHFGIGVNDSYRWMEDLDSAEVAAWVAAQNTLAEAHLNGLPLRAKLRKRITELWNYPKATVPVQEGGRYFYRKNS